MILGDIWDLYVRNIIDSDTENLLAGMADYQNPQKDQRRKEDFFLISHHLTVAVELFLICSDMVVYLFKCN